MIEAGGGEDRRQKFERANVQHAQVEKLNERRLALGSGVQHLFAKW